MPGPPLRVALLGGVPPSLATGGLELQVQRTAAALRRGGHEVFHVGQEQKARAFDLLHAFSSGPDVAHWLTHWRHNAGVPLVVSPVLVVPPGWAEWRQRVAHHLPLPEFGPWQRRKLLRRATVVVALTDYEAGLVRRLAGRRAEPVVVVANGVDAVAEPMAPPGGLPGSYVVLLGTVNRRKRQHETVRALADRGGPAPVVVGAFEGSERERAAFAEAVAAAGGAWLGEVTDQAVVRYVVRRATALVHLSTAEGQSLAVLEALAEGTPVVAAPLPTNRELASRHPGHLLLVEDETGLPAALEALRRMPSARPAIPTWDEVAAQLEQVYRDAGARPGAA